MNKIPFYPWELGNQLSMKIQARDAESAKETFFKLLRVIETAIHPDDLTSLKMRSIQITTLAVRGAYDAGADAHADELMRDNIEFINRIYHANTLIELKKVIGEAMDKFIEYVPQDNYFDNRRIEKAAAFIQKNVNRKISRRQVAKASGISESYLSKLFRKVTGHSFKDFVLKLKIEKSMETMRRNSNKNISEIAYELGFHDPNYFSTVFKRIAGVSPGKYRKSHSGTVTKQNGAFRSDAASGCRDAVSEIKGVRA